MRQLALLIGAGLTLEAALQTLGEDTSKALAWFAGAIRTSISAGDSFAEALERHSTIIEPAYVAMVRAGEASGKLEPVLRAIVEDRTRRELLTDRINSAIRYPTLPCCIGHRRSSVLPDLRGAAVRARVQGSRRANSMRARPSCSRASAWLRANLDLLLGMCLALIPGIWLVVSRPEWRARMIAAFASMPGISGAMRDRRTARIIGTLGLLIENGVALPAALKILRDVVTEPHYVGAVDRVYEQVRNGRRFGDALADTDLLPPLAVRMLRVGDETGDLASIARHAAQFYEHKLGIGLDRLMGAVGPATIILVSVVIGALIISIMSALLSITELAL